MPTEAPLTAAQSKLAAEHFPLARWLAKPLKKDYPHLSAEFESAAVMALVIAARDYREPSPIRFATYAGWRIQKAFTGCFESSPGPIMVFGDWHRGSRGTWIRTTSPSRYKHEVDDLDELAVIARKVPRRAFRALQLTAGWDYSRSEAAKIMGCSPSEVSRLIRRAKSFIGWTVKPPKRDVMTLADH